MITQYKKKDLENIITKNHDLYNVFSLIGDKLRVIYTALGWTHMTKEFGEPDAVIEELTQSVFESLHRSIKDVTYSTGGLTVSGWFDEEDYLNLDYSFYLA